MNDAQHLREWSSSATFREIARLAAAKGRATMRARPRCGAKRKHDSGSCEQPAMANGRCRFHGGRTPKGDDWHIGQWPDRAARDAECKLMRKLQSRERAAKRRAARLAAMTPEERAKHERWHAARKPGAPGPRVAERERRRHDGEARAICSAPRCAGRGAGAEATEIAVAIEDLERLRDQMPRADQSTGRAEAKEGRAMDDHDDAEDAMERVRSRIRTEGVEAAFEALLSVARDPRAAAPARATAGSAIFRAAGLFATTDDGGSKDPAEMTAAELDREIRQLKAAAADVARKRAKPAGDIFD